MADHVLLELADAGGSTWSRSWDIGAEAPFRQPRG
jgi:hypothetical protein